MLREVCECVSKSGVERSLVQGHLMSVQWYEFRVGLQDLLTNGRRGMVRAYFLLSILVPLIK